MMGELVEEIPEEEEITEVQVPLLATGPRTASANRMGFSTFGLSKQDMDFNSRVAGVLQQRHPTSAAASQQQSHSTVGSPSEWTCQLLRLFYPSFYDWQSS